MKKKTGKARVSHGMNDVRRKGLFPIPGMLWPVSVPCPADKWLV